MNCTKGHAIADGSKFCGECGEAAPATLAKATCAGCSTEQDGAHRFCATCGATLMKADAELETALGTLKTFAKAREEMGALEIKPGEHTESAALLATDAEDLEAATEFLKAFLVAQNGSSDILTALVSEVRAIRKEDNGAFAKAMADGLGAIGRSLASISDRLAVIENAPGRPRSVLTPGPHKVTPFNKATAADTHAGDEDTSLRGTELVKAAIAADLAGKLEAGDATAVQRLANRGATLNVLAKAEPAIYGRLVAAIPAQTH